MKRETRSGEVGNVKPDGTLEVLAVAYHVVDDYGSVWMPGVFTRSADERLPVIAWAHAWDEPIGRALGYRDAEEGPYFPARLDIGGNAATNQLLVYANATSNAATPPTSPPHSPPSTPSGTTAPVTPASTGPTTQTPPTVDHPASKPPTNHPALRGI